MNYATCPLPAICLACGVWLPETPGAGSDEGVCEGCFAESEAAAAVAKEAEGIADFRWMSANWFETSHLERLPFCSRPGRFY